VGFEKPIGQRRFEVEPIEAADIREYRELEAQHG
jgi:hypothetical protein